MSNDNLEEPNLTEPAQPEPEPEPAPEPMSPADRLLAFEKRVLGDNHPRHNGKPERGSGSPFAGLPDHHKAHHAALEELVAAEAAHQQASAAEEAAHTRLDRAIRRAADTETATEV